MSEPSVQRSAWQFARYFCVGVWNTLFGYSVFVVFTYMLTGKIPYAYMLAAVLSNVLAITNAYIGYKFFVFKTRGNYLREYLRFYVVYGSAALGGLVLLPILVTGGASWIGSRSNHLLTVFGHALCFEKSTVPYFASAALLGMTMLGSFYGHKNFSFSAPIPATEDNDCSR